MIPKPPLPPIKDQAKKAQEEKVAKRAALVPMAIALVAILGVAGYVFWQNLRPRAVPRFDTGSLADRGLPGPGMGMMDSDGEMVGEPLTHMLHEASLSELMLLQPGDEVLATEPGSLESYPGAVRETGFRRRGSGMTEEVSIWEVRQAALDQVAQHYHQAAEKAGFHLLAAPSGRKQSPATAPAGQTRLYVRAGSAEAGGKRRGPILIVRLSPRSQAVRVMLWLRSPGDD